MKGKFHTLRKENQGAIRTQKGDFYGHKPPTLYYSQLYHILQLGNVIIMFFW